MSSPEHQSMPLDAETEKQRAELASIVQAGRILHSALLAGGGDTSTVGEATPVALQA